MDVRGRGLPGIEQQRRRHLDEAHAAIGKVARLEAQVGDVVDRETVAALRQRREMLGFGRAEAAQRACLNSSTRDGASARFGLEEIEALREIGRDCKASSPHTLQNEPTSLLRAINRRSACTQRNSTAWSMRPIRPAFSAGRNEDGGGKHLALHAGATATPPRVVADLALRQRHQRLQIQVDAVGFDRGLDGRRQLRLAAAASGSCSRSEGGQS